MSAAWPIVLPLALGAAVSPTVLMLQLLLLAGGHRPIARSWAFALGITATSVLYIVALATIAQGLTMSGGPQSTIERVVKLVAAVALAALGVRSLRHAGSGSLVGRVQKMKPDTPLWSFVVLGFIAMWLNLSSLALMLPAVHLAVNSGTQVGAQLVVILLCAVAPAVLPVLAATLLGSHAEQVLSRLNAFTTTHAAQINAGICFLFAVILVLSAWRSA